MKEIKREVTSVEVVYQAADGTEFKSKEECKAYDESARCMLYAKYNQKVINSTTEFNLFGFGSDDCTIEVVKLETQADVDLITQLFLFENKHMALSENRDSLNKILVRMNKALAEKDYVFIGRGCCMDSFYYEGSRNEHIEVLNKACQRDELQAASE